MLAAELLLLLLLGAVLAPDSPIGRWLIHEPAKALAGLTPHTALLGFVAAAMLVAFVAAAPEMAALIGLADLSVMMDLTALMLLAGVAVRFETARTVALRVARQVIVVCRRAARPRRNRLVRHRPAPNEPDSDPGPGWAFA